VSPTANAAAAFEARMTAWSAIAINGLVLLGQLDRLVSERFPFGSIEMVVRVAGIALSCALLTALWTMRKSPQTRFALFACCAGLVPYIVVLPILGHRWDAMGRTWEPFFREKLAMLLVAALTPPRALFGVAIIGAFLVESWVGYYGFDLRHSPYLWPGEPWRTMVYGAFALALLHRRVRDLQRERDLVQREQEALVVERLARVAVAVHDMTNTPLQTLVASTALVEKDPSQTGSVAGGMKRAVEKLQELNDAFATYEKQLEWHIGDESFDPRAVIASAGKSK
jgi:hypothetical protein